MTENQRFVAELEIVRFDDEDVITTSCGSDFACVSECMGYCAWHCEGEFECMAEG